MADSCVGAPLRGDIFPYATPAATERRPPDLGGCFFSHPAGLLVDQLRHQARPAGLMARPQPGAVVAVEILVEQQMIAPVLIVLKRRLTAEHRPATARIG